MAAKLFQGEIFVMLLLLS